MGLRLPVFVCAALVAVAVVILQAGPMVRWYVLIGEEAWADSAKLAPGMARQILAANLPTPSASGTDGKQYVRAPEGTLPKAPPGFTVNLYADTGLNSPRQIRVAPNGDAFVTNQVQGTVTVFRGIGPDGKAQITETFAAGLRDIFGVNFYPVGNDPQWVYVSEQERVYRYPYRNGDLRARGEPERIIDDIPFSGHSTRDMAFSLDGARLFIGVGSNSNINDPDIFDERRRANILEYTPAGQFVRIYASGIRNPSGVAVHPSTGEVWTSVNERDELGDNIAPDYITHVRPGGFYGWPYYYAGGIRDNRLKGAHPELQSQTILPDVLIQAHSASLGLTFYTGSQFPAEYREDIFAAEHGSWNRSVKAGHEVIRIPLYGGRATGVYQDFLTGFLDENGHPWGRPVGVAVASDGSLLVTDDYGHRIWRVSYTGPQPSSSPPVRRSR